MNDCIPNCSSLLISQCIDCLCGGDTLPHSMIVAAHRTVCDVAASHDTTTAVLTTAHIQSLLRALLRHHTASSACGNARSGVVMRVLDVCIALSQHSSGGRGLLLSTSINDDHTASTPTTTAAATGAATATVTVNIVSIGLRIIQSFLSSLHTATSTAAVAAADEWLIVRSICVMFAAHARE